MWQSIVVGAIVLAAGFYVYKRLSRNFKPKANAGCGCGCSGGSQPQPVSSILIPKDED